MDKFQLFIKKELSTIEQDLEKFQNDDSIEEYLVLKLEYLEKLISELSKNRTRHLKVVNN